MTAVWMLAAAVAVAPAAAGPDRAYAAWTGCMNRTVRAAAQDNRVPEEVPALFNAACPDERQRYLRAAHPTTPAATSDGRLEVALARYVRRYAIFYTTGQ